MGSVGGDRSGMKGGLRNYAVLTDAQRQQTLDAYDDLLAAAEEAISEGWHPSELHETVAVHARRLGVFVWPVLARRIVADARRSVPSPV